MPSGKQHQLADRLRWHIQQMLHHDEAGAVLVLRPLTRHIPGEQFVAGFDPVADRIRGLIRRSDVLEVDLEDGIGIVLIGTGSEGARAVFLRLRDALCAPIPPNGPHEVSAAVAFGYAASSACSASNAHAGERGCVAHTDGGAEVSPLEMSATAMLRAAWQPQLVLPLTLPLLRRHTTEPASHSCARSEQAMEAGPWLPRYRAKADAPDPGEQTPEADDVSDTTEAAQQQMGQRAYLRLVTKPHTELPELEVWCALARTMGVPFVRMPAHLPRSCRTALHPTVACEMRAVPIRRTRGTLTIAMHDPSDTHAVRRLHTLTGLNIVPVLAAPDEIDRALRQIMGQITVIES